MTITVKEASPLEPGSRALIEGSEAALRAVYPPEACFSFSPEELAAPGCSFFIAEMGSAAAGCIALHRCEGYAELKRLFVLEGARGSGAAAALVAHAESVARGEGIPLMRLETGPELAAAVRLYARLGYTERPAFGDYDAIPESLFMEKTL